MLEQAPLSKDAYDGVSSHYPPQLEPVAEVAEHAPGTPSDEIQQVAEAAGVRLREVADGSQLGHGPAVAAAVQPQKPAEHVDVGARLLMTISDATYNRKFVNEPVRNQTEVQADFGGGRICLLLRGGKGGDHLPENAKGTAVLR